MDKRNHSSTAVITSSGKIRYDHKHYDKCPITHVNSPCNNMPPAVLRRALVYSLLDALAFLGVLTLISVLSPEAAVLFLTVVNTNSLPS